VLQAMTLVPLLPFHPHLRPFAEDYFVSIFHVMIVLVEEGQKEREPMQEKEFDIVT
jgi:hypothetical protein